MAQPTTAQMHMHYVFIILFFSLILAVSAYMAAFVHLTGYEISVFRKINGLPSFLRLFFLAVTQLGSVWMLFAVTLGLLWRRLNRLAVRVFALGTTAYFITEALKYLVSRPRPSGLLATINLRESLIFGYGFPSGHTAVATTLSLLLILLFPPRWRWFAYIWILLVGLSRIYLGVHMPLDIIGGVSVGIVVVYSNYLVRNKLKYVTKITHMKLSN